MLRFRSLAAALLVLAGCSPLSLLNGANSVTPGDGDVRRVVDGASFGPDPRQRLDVWAPTASAPAARPVLIFFYGGNWSTGKRGDYAFAARAYAAKGFIVVVPDYRLVPAHPYPAFVQDGALAVRWTRDHVAEAGGDPARITLAGHSAGGYIAAMVTLDRRWLTAAGVDPGIVRATATLAGPFDFYPFTSPVSRAAFAGAPDPAATQPIRYARADAPPMWLGTGSDDTTVYPRNSRNLADRLTRLGATVTYREYPGVGHIGMVTALSKPFRGKAPVLADSAAFLLANSQAR